MAKQKHLHRLLLPWKHEQFVGNHDECIEHRMLFCSHLLKSKKFQGVTWSWLVEKMLFTSITVAYLITVRLVLIFSIGSMNAVYELTRLPFSNVTGICANPKQENSC